jgi:hypothetical protein
MKRGLRKVATGTGSKLGAYKGTKGCDRITVDTTSTEKRPTYVKELLEQHLELTQVPLQCDTVQVPVQLLPY